MHACRLLFATILLAAAAAAHSASSAPGATAGLYGRQVYLAADASKAAQESAKALAGWLNRMTGAEFPVVNTPGRQGIFLAPADGKVLPPVDLAALRAKDSAEAFLIYSDDANRLWIVGKSDLALDRGVYWYLDKLGCRWLVPGEHWTIIPKRRDIALKINSLQAPAFFMRTFFGTGGFGRPAIDPDQHAADAWMLYQRQNLLGGTFSLGGHYGEYFNLTHKQELLDHPDYLAEIDGKRQPYDQGTKPCYANPGLQALYVKDRVTEMRETLKRDPSAMSVSVEPSDGGGHCACAACRQLGTVSDRVFTLANLAARAVAKEFPGKYVNLYAYNEHAMTPIIPVEPNIIVSLVAYGFQYTGLTPEEFIRAWGTKHSFLGMYDYWDIPDWSNCLPDITTKMIAEKIRFWRQQHVKVFNSESTFCGGDMGLGWYVASRLLWNPDLDEGAIVDDFFQQAFSEARAPMRRMYDRWEGGFMLTDNELGLCYRDLHEAVALAKDPGVRARLADMGRYLHYLRLWYEYSGAKSKSPERLAHARTLIDYLWRTYHSNMVQSFRMAQLIGDRYEQGTLDDIAPGKEMWKDIPQLTDAEIGTRLADGMARYQPLDYPQRRYSRKLVPLAAAPAAPPAWLETGSYGYDAGFNYAVRPGDGRQVTLQMSIWARENKYDHVVATGPTGATVFDAKIPADGAWHDLVIPAEQPGLYRLSVYDAKNIFRLRVPSALPFACVENNICADLSPRTYFFVPAGVRKVAVYCPDASLPLELRDPQGTVVTVDANERQKSLFVIDIPAGMDNRCWSYARHKSWLPLHFLNVPDVVSFSPDGMLVPAEVKPAP